MSLNQRTNKYIVIPIWKSKTYVISNNCIECFLCKPAQYKSCSIDILYSYKRYNNGELD